LLLCSSELVRLCLTLCLALTFHPAPEICGTGVTLFLAALLSEITATQGVGFALQPVLLG